MGYRDFTTWLLRGGIMSYIFANYDELLKAAPQNYTSCYFSNWIENKPTKNRYDCALNHAIKIMALRFLCPVFVIINVIISS